MRGLLAQLLKTSDSPGISFGLLIYRIAIGVMMAAAHGFSKMEKLFEPGPVQWADPLNIGPFYSLLGAASAEFVCSIFLIFGVFTRLMALPLAFTMFVAVFIVHADDPFQKMELGLMYFFGYVLLFFTGPGKFSFDARWEGKLRVAIAEKKEARLKKKEEKQAAKAGKSEEPAVEETPTEKSKEETSREETPADPSSESPEKTKEESK